MGVPYLFSTALIIFGALTVYPVGCYATEVSDNGLGKDYNWLSLEDGLLQAKNQKKPLMLVIHKSWCGACKALKPEFAASIGIKALSSKFVMVNTMDSEEPADKIYAPDGGYIPRILFLSPDGEVLEDITNEEGNPSYKYYYFNVNDIISSMKKVIDLYKSADIQDEL
ncbi:thioredoxin domain-containing protein 12-like [Ischnura elegans]|uniref:thioredoxin domain-containing protein 12-like n=1 Tax=Ischnura elegans TaxID=197161 RepID=UPI001ED89C32|nr:thioredoxin domain-containing protein 12-like [Ischnura elegans]